MVTEIGGEAMVKLTVSDFVASLTDVAVMVGALFGAAGTVPGGV